MNLIICVIAVIIIGAPPVLSQTYDTYLMWFKGKVQNQTSLCNFMCNGELHPFCSDVKEVAPNCRKLNIDQTFRNAVIKAHNKIRNEVAAGTKKVDDKNLPKAADMNFLQYDFKLEDYSNWCVNSCSKERKECAKEDIEISYNDKTPYDDYLKTVSQINLISDKKLETQSEITTFLEEEFGKSVSSVGLTGAKALVADTKTIAVHIMLASNILMGCSKSYMVSQNKYMLTCHYAPGFPDSDNVYKTGPPKTQCRLKTNNTRGTEEFKSLCFYGLRPGGAAKTFEGRNVLKLLFWVFFFKMVFKLL